MKGSEKLPVVVVVVVVGAVGVFVKDSPPTSLLNGLPVPKPPRDENGSTLRPGRVGTV